MPRLIEEGTFEVRCQRCMSGFSYKFHETYETCDYLGDSNGRFVKCPACEGGVRHVGTRKLTT